jgi:acyl carrier protein
MARIAATGKEKALWLLEEVVPDTGINNIGIAVQVEGRLRPDALNTSVAIMLDGHETLRTVFYAAGAELVKEVIPAGGLEVDIQPIELGGEPLEQTLSAFAGRPFTLAGQPLIRVGRAAHPDGDILCLAVHHLVFDAISIGLFLRAFIGAYESLAAGQPGDPPEPCHDALPEQVPRPASLAYWRENLRGFAPDGLGLWCGLPHVHKPLMTGDTVTHTLSAQARDALPRLQRETRAPVAAVLLAAYYALLASHGAGPDLVVGSPIDARGAQPAAAIGYHVNVVPLRLRVDFAESFRQLARRTRDVFLAALAHADISVDEMLAELPRSSSSGQAALYRHMFNYLPDTYPPETGAAELVIDGMPARLLPVDNGFSKFDLELFVVPGQPDIRFRYRDEVLTRADVTAMLRRYEAILTGAAMDPERPVGELAGWSEQDRETIAVGSANARSFILAPDGRELPIGVRGELCFAADGVRYRSGELACWRPDGTIQRLGQLSRQVMIAGRRVNLDEVDRVLLDQEGVAAAAAVTVPGGALVAFAEVAGTQQTSRLRTACMARLDPPAVPGHVVCVETLPRTTSGQVDHEALVRLATSWLEDRPDQAADDPLVTELTGMWRRLLDADVTARTAFFDAGGHSLLAAKLAQDVEELTGVHLELSEIFNYSTPVALAARLTAIADEPAQQAAQE